MALKIFKTASLTAPLVIIPILTLGVWNWGMHNTIFTVAMVYMAVYFTYWLCTEFLDNCI